MASPPASSATSARVCVCECTIKLQVPLPHPPARINSTFPSSPSPCEKKLPRRLGFVPLSPEGEGKTDPFSGGANPEGVCFPDLAPGAEREGLLGRALVPICFPAPARTKRHAMAEDKKAHTWARVCNLNLTDLSRGLPMPWTKPPHETKEKDGVWRMEGMDVQPKVLEQVIKLLKNVNEEQIKTSGEVMEGKIDAKGNPVLEALLRREPNIFDVLPTDEDNTTVLSSQERKTSVNEIENGKANEEEALASLPRPLSPIKRRPSKKVERTMAPDQTDYAEKLSQLLKHAPRIESDVMQEDEEERQEYHCGEDSELSTSYLHKVDSVVANLVKSRKLIGVPEDALCTLTQILLRYLGQGEFRLLDDLDCEESDAFREVMGSLDACITLLRLMTTKGMAKQLYREEIIEKMITLIRHHTNKHILPAYDPTARQMKLLENQPDGGSAVKKGRKFDSWQNGAPFAAKCMLERLVVIISMLEELILVEKLHDHLIVQLLKTMLLVLSAPGLAVLKNKGANIVRTVFYNYKQHRSFVMEEAVSLFYKSASGKRTETYFEVPETDRLRIQITSALILQLIQVAPLPLEMQDSPAEDQSHADPFLPAVEWSVIFWQEVFSRWQASRNQEIDVRSLLDNFLHDILAVHFLPEWPAASLLLQTFCQVVGGEKGLQNPDSSVRLACTDMMGKIIAHLKFGIKEASLDEDWQLDTVIHSCTPDGMASHANENRWAQDMGVKSMLKLMPALVGSVCGHDTKISAFHAWQHVLAVYLRQSLSKEDLLNVSACRFYLHRLLADNINVKHATAERVLVENVLQKHDLPTLEISRNTAQKIARMIALQQPLALNCDSILLKWLVGMCDKTQQAPNIRVRGIRSLGYVVEADKDMLGNPGIQLTIESSFKDDSVSVREAALELLGRHAVNCPDYAEKYFCTISSCVDDIGISVRKRVLRVLRELCTKQLPGFSYSIDALACILSKVHDREEGIQELVLKSFCDFLFPDMHGISDRDEAMEHVNFVRIVQEMYKRESGEVLIKLPMVKETQIVTVVSRLLHANLKGVSTSSVYQRFCNISEQLLELAIREESKDTIEGTDQGGLWPCMALHALSTADPSLCMPEADPAMFLVALMPYVQTAGPIASGTPGKGNPELQRWNATKLLCLLSVFNSVLPRLGGLPVALAENLDKAARSHLVNERILYTQVVVSCSQCLCSLAKLDPGTAETVIYLVTRFMSALQQLLTDDASVLNPKTRSFRIQRALFAIGHICRFGMGSNGWEGNLQVAASRRDSAIELEGILTLICHFVEQDDLKVKSYALQAMGSLSISRPHLLMTEHIHRIMCSCLSPDAPFSLQERALRNLIDFMKSEEENLVEIQEAEMKQQDIDRKRKQSRQLAQCAGQGDSTLSSGVAQRYWNEILALMTNPRLHSCTQHPGAPINAQIRFRALELADVVLRQGLVHPMTVFPQLVALCGDPNRGVRAHAIGLLAQETEKHPEFFELRLADGLRMAWKFQRALHAAGSLQSTEESMEQRKSASGLISPGIIAGVNQMYLLINKHRSTRNRFLTCLLQLFERFGEHTKGSIRSAAFSAVSSNVAGEEPEDLSFLAFCADILSCLTFCKVDEPLFCIYKINGILSLKAPMVLSSLQSALGTIGKSLRSPSGKVEKEEQECVPSTPDGMGGESLTPSESMKSECSKAVAVSILFLLKQYLKAVYTLSEDKILMYNPHESSRKEDRVPVTVSKVDHFSIYRVKLDAANDLKGIIDLYQFFKSLVKSDSYDYGSQPSTRRGKRSSTDPGLATPTKEESSGFSSGSGQVTPLSDMQSPKPPLRTQPSRLSKSSVRRKLIESDEEEGSDGWQASDDEKPATRRTRRKLLA